LPDSAATGGGSSHDECGFHSACKPQARRPKHLLAGRRQGRPGRKAGTRPPRPGPPPPLPPPPPPPRGGSLGVLGRTGGTGRRGRRGRPPLPRPLPPAPRPPGALDRAQGACFAGCKRVLGRRCRLRARGRAAQGARARAGLQARFTTQNRNASLVSWDGGATLRCMGVFMGAETLEGHLARLALHRHLPNLRVRLQAPYSPSQANGGHGSATHAVCCSYTAPAAADGCNKAAETIVQHAAAAWCERPAAATAPPPPPPKQPCLQNGKTPC